jgi:hypothetical protein
MSLPATSFTAFSFIHTHSPSQVRQESLVWFFSRSPAPCVTTIATNHLGSSSTRLTASLRHPAVRNYNLAIFPLVYLPRRPLSVIITHARAPEAAVDNSCK